MQLAPKCRALDLFWKSTSELMFIEFYFYYTLVGNNGFFCLAIVSCGTDS